MTEEKDPYGFDPHQPGAKLDHGKTMTASILGQFARALDQVAQVGTFGANKYTLGGWQEVSDGERRYADAQMRHWIKRQMDEDFDPDSGLLHKAHEAWNCLAELELMLREGDGNEQG